MFGEEQRWLTNPAGVLLSDDRERVHLRQHDHVDHRRVISHLCSTQAQGMQSESREDRELRNIEEQSQQGRT
jgi:hypothetical protein